MEPKLLDFSELEKGKIYRDVLSGRPVLISKVILNQSFTNHFAIGLIYNPVTGTDEHFEACHKRLIKLEEDTYAN